MTSKVDQKLRALIEFGQALTSRADLRQDGILELICRQASKLMDTDNMYIALYDETADTVRFGLAFVDGRRVDVAAEQGWRPRKAGEGRTEEIIRTKNPILTTTKAEAEAWYAQREHKEYVGRAFASWIGVPMLVGEKVLGVIATYHPTQDHVYDGDDLEILQAIAAQAAIALNEVNAFDSWQQELEHRAQREKFSYLGLLAGGVAHRVGSKGGLIRLHVNNLRKLISPEEKDIQELIAKIERDNEYLLELSDALFKPADASETPVGPVDANQLVRESIDRANLPADVKCSFKQVELPAVIGNKWLVEVFVELIANAVHAMSKSAKKNLQVSAQLAAENIVCITFEDTGCGIAPDDLPKIFDLFFVRGDRSIPVRGGYGLWWCKTILTQMRGDLKIESEVGKGTRCKVILPVAGNKEAK